MATFTSTYGLGEEVLYVNGGPGERAIVTAVQFEKDKVRYELDFNGEGDLDLIDADHVWPIR